MRPDSMATQEQANSFRDEMFISWLESFTQPALDYLTQICESDEQFVHLTYDSFVALNPNQSPDRLAQSFDVTTNISKAELRAQLKFDLCLFYLHDKKYQLAKECVEASRENYRLMQDEYKARGGATEYLFCTLTEDELLGCLMACGVSDAVDAGLLMQMNVSIMDQHKVGTRAS